MSKIGFLKFLASKLVRIIGRLIFLVGVFAVFLVEEGRGIAFGLVVLGIIIEAFGQYHSKSR